MKKALIRRIILMVLGLFLSSLGVSFSIKAELGTSPIACCPAVYAAPLHVSVGTAMMLLCVLMLLIQILIQRKEFPPVQSFQLVLAFLFGSQTDLTSILLRGVAADTVQQKCLYCALGIFILAFGIFLLLAADLFMLSPDAMAAVIAKKSGIEFGKLKVILDVVLVMISAAGSFRMYGRLVHIGVGTLAAAVLVGNLVRLFKRIEPLNAFLLV